MDIRTVVPVDGDGAPKDGVEVQRDLSRSNYEALFEITAGILRNFRRGLSTLRRGPPLPPERW